MEQGEGRGSEKEVGRTTTEGGSMKKQQYQLEAVAGLQFALLMLRLGVKQK